MTSHPPFTVNNLELLREMEVEVTTFAADCQPEEGMDLDTYSINATAAAQLLDQHIQPCLRIEVTTAGEDPDARSGETGEDLDAHKQSTHPSCENPLQKQPSCPSEDSVQRDYDENKVPQTQESFVLCQSPSPSLKRQNLELPPLVSGRTSAGSSRKASVGSGRCSVQRTEESSRKGSQEAAHKDDNSYYHEMTLTERRMAMVKNRFSSRNLFNVRRQTATSVFTPGYSGKADSSEASRKSMSDRIVSQQRPFAGGQGRPVTSLPAFPGRQFHPSNGLNRLNFRPATSTSKVSSFGNQHVDAFVPRKPRSRRQLEKLSQMRIDPFGMEKREEEEEESGERWMDLEDIHQDLLQKLRRRGPSLQERVASFLQDLDDFNRRGHKTGLEHILEIT